VFVGGDEPRIGKRDVDQWDFHYVDPSSPYGPFTAGKGGVAFFTLRAPHAPPDTHMMPAEREKLPRRAGRHLLGSPPESYGAEPACETLVERHDDGLAAFCVSVGPNEPLTLPDPAGSGGYYGIVIDGSLARGSEEYPVRSLLWVGPKESAPQLLAGQTGVALLLVQFPVPDPSMEPAAHAAFARAEAAVTAQ
jgi:hypothetical protein